MQHVQETCDYPNKDGINNHIWR